MQGKRSKRARRNALGLLVVLSVLVATALVAAGKWKSLREDGLHDPRSPVLSMLQEPSEALSRLPPNPAGNLVDWIGALQKGVIQPRSSLHGDKEGELRDTEVLLKYTGNMPYVLFPHKAHTEWLDCENCHEELFSSEGKTPGLKMLAILQGEFCGRCHGAVAFPLTECNRCHSVRPEVPSAFQSIPDELSQ